MASLVERLDDYGWGAGDGVDTAAEAALGLAKRHIPVVLAHLESHLQDSDVSYLAVQAAGVFGDPSLLDLLRKERLERDLENELASHLELHIADNLRAGMTPEEARRTALLLPMRRRLRLS